MINNLFLCVAPMASFRENARGGGGSGRAGTRFCSEDESVPLFLRQIFFNALLVSPFSALDSCHLSSLPALFSSFSVCAREIEKENFGCDTTCISGEKYLFFKKGRRRSPAQFLPQGSNTVLSLKNFLLLCNPWSWPRSDIYSKIEINYRSQHRE